MPGPLVLIHKRGEISSPFLEVKFEEKPRELIVRHFQKAWCSVEAGAVCVCENTQSQVDMQIMPHRLFQDTGRSESWGRRTVEQGVFGQFIGTLKQL